MFTKIYTNKKFILLTVVLYLITSLAGLYVDVLNTDGINWHTRSNNFVNALMKGDFKNTYQSYHPGITLMWVSGPVLHVLGDVLLSKGRAFYSYDTYLIYDYVAKITVVAATATLFTYALWLLQKILSKKGLTFFAALMILEPFVLGQRRLYHLDFLMTTLIFCSFLSIYYYAYKSRKTVYLFLSALFLVLGVLTKSSGAIFTPIPFLIILVSKADFKQKAASWMLFSVMSLITLYAAVPALWKNPIKASVEIYHGISAGAMDIGYLGKKEVGFGGAKGNITLDEISVNGSYDYYVKALFYTLSPISLCILTASLIWFFGSVFKRKPNTLNVLSILTVLLFLVIMSISNKKGIRYGIIFYPFLFLIMANFLSVLKTRFYTGALIVFAVSLVPQYIQIYPYFYAYANPLLGGVKARVEVFKPGSLGVAAYAVNQKIQIDAKSTNYTISANKSLGVINKKGVVATSFNCSSDYVVVYYLDKERVRSCGGSISLLSTVKVGNLDYWEIYKKAAL